MVIACRYLHLNGGDRLNSDKPIFNRYAECVNRARLGRCVAESESEHSFDVYCVGSPLFLSVDSLWAELDLSNLRILGHGNLRPKTHCKTFVWDRICRVWDFMVTLNGVSDGLSEKNTSSNYRCFYGD